VIGGCKAGYISTALWLVGLIQAISTDLWLVGLMQAISTATSFTFVIG